MSGFKAVGTAFLLLRNWKEVWSFLLNLNNTVAHKLHLLAYCAFLMWTRIRIYRSEVNNLFSDKNKKKLAVCAIKFLKSRSFLKYLSTKINTVHSKTVIARASQKTVSVKHYSIVFDLF
jgi:hypothetical protein